jgi:glycosyltransferase involved in cell wall biosynthesis
MARQVRGLLVNTPAEGDLVARLYQVQPERVAVSGIGMSTDWTGNAERFAKNYGLRDFILYAGRRDAGKGVPMLLDYYCRYVRETGDPVDLVLLGKGDVFLPQDTGPGRIRDLGFVPPQDKYDCFAAARFFCLPSLYESFSIVMMEAWLAETAVVAFEPCEVTKQHCLSSNGGLFFKGYEEFLEIAQELRAKPQLRGKLAANGRKYVLENYTWEKVCDRFMTALEGWGWPREEFLAQPSR